ncbi:MAG: hypothetical protein P1P65_08480 [Treponema sp.]
MYPLWLAATQYTPIYTAVCLTGFSALLLAFIIRRNIAKYRYNRKRFFHTLIKRSILCSGIILFFTLLFAYQRLSAFVVLILSFVLYGFIAFGFSEDRT